MSQHPIVSHTPYPTQVGTYSAITLYSIQPSRERSGRQRFKIGQTKRPRFTRPINHGGGLILGLCWKKPGNLTIRGDARFQSKHLHHLVLKVVIITHLQPFFTVKIVRNKPGFFAELLYQSMEGPDASHKTLIRLLVTRCETDLGNIKQEFQRMYGVPLAVMLSVGPHFSVAY